MPRIVRWLFVALWLATPLALGPAFASWTNGWSTPTAVAAEVLAWITFGIVLLAAVVARPWSLTAIRIVLPAIVAFGAWALVAEPGPEQFVALGWAVPVAGLALNSAPLARAYLDGDALGDEQRFPLRVPPPLLLGPLPLAVAVATTGIVAGPLLLSAGQWIPGVAAVLLGIPIAGISARAVHGLSTRMVVFVPAGLTIVDSYTLTSAVHLPRGDIAAVGSTRRVPKPADVDLRVGAVSQGVRIALTRPTDSLTLRRGRAGTATARAEALLISPAPRPDFLDVAAARGLPVQRASAPPSSTSPS